MRGVRISPFESDVPGIGIVPCATDICLRDAEKLCTSGGSDALSGPVTSADQMRPKAAKRSLSFKVYESIWPSSAVASSRSEPRKQDDESAAQTRTSAVLGMR